MSRTIHRVKQAGAYLITTDSWQRREIFLHPTAAEILIDEILLRRSTENFRLHAFVVMPDHLHLLLTPSATCSLERILQLIKGGSAFRIRKLLDSKFPVWHAGYHDHWIRDAADFHTRKRYIELNPVRALLAGVPSEYPWSSASTNFPLDPPPAHFATSAAKAAPIPNPNVTAKAVTRKT